MTQKPKPKPPIPLQTAIDRRLAQLPPEAAPLPAAPPTAAHIVALERRVSSIARIWIQQHENIILPPTIRIDAAQLPGRGFNIFVSDCTQGDTDHTPWLVSAHYGTLSGDQLTLQFTEPVLWVAYAPDDVHHLRVLKYADTLDGDLGSPCADERGPG